MPFVEPETGFSTELLARDVRAHSLRMAHKARSPHIGSCLSIADLLAVLYGKVLRVRPKDPGWEGRDRFILSKGHAAAALYAVLAERGFIHLSALESYCQEGSLLLGHASHHVPGVEVSTGSLGHGLPVGCGMALAGKRAGGGYRVIVLLGDGELDEGSNWEAILFAAQHRLDDLTVIVDYNKIQSFGTVKEVLDLDPLGAKWLACGWGVREIDGHNLDQIEEALDAVRPATGQPTVVIAHTVKGKGVSFMEGRIVWHYKSPNDEQLAAALAEVAAS